MADIYNYISGDLLCALLHLFVDGILGSTNKKKFSKWRHQTIFANFLVLTRPKCLLFSNKRKGVKIGQNAFTLNQSDTPLVGNVSSILVSAITKISMVSDIKGLRNSILFPIQLIFKYAMKRPLRFFRRIVFNAVFASASFWTDSPLVLSSTFMAVNATFC